MKDGVLHYVKIVKKLFLAFSFIAIPAFMVSLVFAFGKSVPFYFIAPAIAVCYFVVYGFYAMHVSMGTVTGIEITDKVVHLKTPRKTFTYDVNMGCVEVKTFKNKFVGTFQTQNSRDKFIFYRRVLFTKSYIEQFTAEDVLSFFPSFCEYPQSRTTEGANT